MPAKVLTAFYSRNGTRHSPTPTPLPLAMPTANDLEVVRFRVRRVTQVVAALAANPTTVRTGRTQEGSPIS